MANEKIISIVIPTIDGREDYFKKCVESYEKNTINKFEIVVIRNKPTVGIAWNEGADKSNGYYIHLTNDDIEAKYAWDVPAIEAAEANKLPHPSVYTFDGRLDDRYGGAPGDWSEVDMSTIHFMKKETWEKVGPSLDVHYYTDDWLSWKGWQLGFPTVVRKDYAFIHHYAQVGRGAGMHENDRMNHDRQYFLNAQNEFLNGKIDVR